MSLPSWALWVTNRLLLWKKSPALPKIPLDEATWWLKPLANREAELATDAAGLISAEAPLRIVGITGVSGRAIARVD
jgi:hypothetical protein